MEGIPFVYLILGPAEHEEKLASFATMQERSHGKDPKSGSLIEYGSRREEQATSRDKVGAWLSFPNLANESVVGWTTS